MSTPKRLRRQANPAARPARRRSRRWLLFAGAGAVALAVTVAVIVAGEVGRGDDPPAALASTVFPGVPREGRVLGQPDATVTIEEWADFQCPACQLFSQQIKSRIVQDYVATGKAKLIFRDMAFIGDESLEAAAAARCAADQGAFWEFEDALYKRQGGENSGTFSRSMFVELAGELGLEGSTFAACYDGGKYQDDVKDEVEEGQALGIRSTPSIFINGRRAEAWSDYASLAQVIERELAR